MFSCLLAPGSIGTMRLRNRLVMSPMETMYGTPAGHPSERTVAHFATRAAGGVGLVTVGATGIDPQHPETPGGLQIGEDAAVPAHRRLVEAVHDLGAKIQPQIVHAGPDGLGPEMYGVTSLGPSVIGSYLTGRPSTEASKEQIAAILDQFRAAVLRVREAGYDGIELHAAHGYMFLGSFLAPQRNRRTDRYRGSSVEGRIRVVLEALTAIRAEVGADFPITLRISGYERVAGGRPIHDTATIAPLLVEAGVDAFHVSGGVIDRLVTGMVNGADDGDGLNVGAAAAVREAVDVPVIAVGRLHDPALAEQVLAEGRADFVALGRPLLADPDLPRKLAGWGGGPARVRRCISCENCIDTLEEKLAAECAVNPFTGHERELAALAPGSGGVGVVGGAGSAGRRRVVVLGGGPAGMETARLAAGAGHEVTLLEQGRCLGGALVAACAVHPENRPYLDWLLAEVDHAGVDVRLGVDADAATVAATVAALAPDVVVAATGGRVVLPQLPGADLPHVHRGLDGLAGGGLDGLAGGGLGPDALPVGRRVVVLGGRLAAVELAETLARAGRLVALLHTGDEVATEVGAKRRTEHMDRLDALGVTVHVGCVVEAITPDGVRYVPAHGRPRDLPADAVVLAGDVVPDEGVGEALRTGLAQAGLDVAVHTVGDAALGLGLIRGATAGAARLVAAL
ncbi:FAD-dependent oxidoreductase [Nocardioides sp. zg-536]|uniref:FAD-dependent oxidoreductase n=1 Tax=Nocardioides faecalis TaxID=2803858 RepID=A0A938Y5Y0_9ACTN|nr:FAD-dependent oxidoreductase [Nocardioides faecalis]MBM9459832.1 FAD-dependent oxidoreductase [Nocardioides faecalis]QVI58927.1 FAD-dependent oxidoreductase [Nocardioides faecalis]